MAASRNGGWCSALFPTATAALERRHGRDAAVAMCTAMVATVDEVGRAATAEGIDCDFVRGGTLAFARSAVQERAARAEIAEAVASCVDALEGWPTPRGGTGALGATFDPACARLHPAKLVRGRARVVESRGVTIHEQTEVLSWAEGSVATTRGTVRGDRIVVATEGYGAAHRRQPVRVRRTGHALSLGQQHPRFARSLTERIRPPQAVAERLVSRSSAGAGDASVGWTARCRPGLARERDGRPATGIASAGGYVGAGLSTTNLAGRTVADLLTGADTPLTRLPWGGHHSPDWEPEPLRFVGSNLGMIAMRVADSEERVTGRLSLAARIMGPLVGH